MQSPSAFRVVIVLLLTSLLVRAGIAATMPVTMLTSHTPATAHAMADMPPDCPGHAAMQADQASNVQSCAYCGECCVSAPVLMFDPTSMLVQSAPDVMGTRTMLPPLSYLTPGIDRPPSL